MIKFLKFICIVLFISAISVCSSCENEPEQQKTILDSVLTAEEQQCYEEFLDDQKIKHPGNSWPERIQYYTIMEDFDSVTEVELKGLPVLIVKSIKEQSDEEIKSDYFDGFELARILVDISCSISRIDSDFFYDPNKHIIDIPENYYVFWKYAKSKLPEIAASDMSYDEKLDKYVEFGYFAVPYVKEEVEKGNTEYEKFFSLVGAHLSTADYMKVIEITEWDQPLPPEEEIEKSLLESGADFDYKKWLNENEEDLNNLFKFLDEYVKDYESKITE